ncbi:hypothetical protein [Streptomyces sp. NPDC004266]|uniref:hypothetical protein n=1 Tax=Streptomyces sp. NPDC004266 TaxID=3364693 RepID=UPI003696035B
MTSNEETARTERLSAAHHMADGVRIMTLRGEIDHITKGDLHNALLPRATQQHRRASWRTWKA